MSKNEWMGAALAIAASSACSQAAPPTAGDVLRQVQPSQAPQPKPSALPNIGGVALPPPLGRLPAGGAVAMVDRVVVEGNRVIGSEELQARVSPKASSSMTLAKMEQLASELTLYYRDRGYFVARAYVPAQDLTDGKLVLRIVEGNYGRFILDNRSLVRDDVVQALLDDIKGRDIVSLDTLERAMLIINDTPGVKVVRADVMPGQAVGTSDFAVGTEATARYDGYAMLDNYGSRYTGKDRLSFNGDWNSPTGHGDRLSLGGLVTTTGGLLNLRAAYSTLVHANGTRMEGVLSRTTYSLGDTYKPLDAVGTADSFELNLTSPIKRTRNANVELGAGLAHRELDDQTRSVGTQVRKHSDAISLRVNGNWTHDLFGSTGFTQVSAAVTVGHLGFSDNVAAMQDAAGAKTSGDWSKLNLSLMRITMLPADWQLSLSARAQHVLNNKNLDGSERLSVSGPGAVMAYPSGELAGDNAVVLRGELSRPIGTWYDVHYTGSAYCAWAVAGAAQPLLPQNHARHLGDVGVNLDAAMGKFTGRLTIAHRVQGGPAQSEPSSATVLLVQVGMTF